MLWMMVLLMTAISDDGTFKFDGGASDDFSFDVDACMCPTKYKDDKVYLLEHRNLSQSNVKFQNLTVMRLLYEYSTLCMLKSHEIIIFHHLS